MSAFEVIYYVCIRWYFIKKKTRIIEIQRQVNDSVDNDRLNSALGILLHPVPSPSPRIVQAINNNFNTDYGGGFPNWFHFTFMSMSLKTDLIQFHSIYNQNVMNTSISELESAFFDQLTND